ncbi:MAG: hypothetical protein QM652_10265 [Legionella sp.]|uniref:hypothetical protein n=1 Tax=Legionella sp. TaxID=459 RepID=UPI0039E46151
MTKSTCSTAPNLFSAQGWYHFGQEFMNSTYLQPFKRPLEGNSKKENTRNGYIEREIHGAMHASRVAWSTVMLHRLCQQQYPHEVQNKVQALMQFSNLNEDELFYLIRYVSLGHDTAREDEGFDRWEEGSAKNIECFLIEKGVSSLLAEIFSRLALYKDKPQELAHYLASHSLAQEIIEGLQYARLLISLADCFDIIRCTDKFKFAVVEQKITEVFSYAKDKDGPIFFDYAKHLLHLLKQQKDLCFPTQLIGPNKECFHIEKSEQEYSMQEKVKLEHADNAISAMLNSINQDPYLQKLLNLETPIFSSTYDKEPAFVPYIHGTNSATLALMPQTNFQLMSPITMLEEYQLAPLCGELTQGGLNSATADGQPCFAKLNGGKDRNEYSLNSVIYHYTKINEVLSKEDCLAKLIAYSTHATKDLFYRINIINIYLARAKQLGINLQEISVIQNLEENFHQVKDIFYLYLLLSTHIIVKPNLSSIDSEEISSHFSLAKVLEKLKQSKISIQDIYNNPTAENCQHVIDLFTFSKNDKTEYLFEYIDSPQEKRKDKSNLEQYDYGYMIYNRSSWSFENILHETCRGHYQMFDFQHIAPSLIDYVEVLEKRFLVTQKLLHEHSKPLKLSPEDLALVENPLPIILLYNQSHQMHLLEVDSQEYRVEQSLKLGKDIQIVATDTEANIKRLQAYSDRHHLNLTIISFADLKRAHRSLATEYPLSNQQILSRPPDIKTLNDFCEQQKARFNTNSVLTSLVRFQEKAKEIILSDLSSKEKRAQLKACAHKQFEHRHYVPRLLADVLMLISSFVLVGLAVGITRVLNGHSFFFSLEKTRRETTFIEIADKMNLGAG